MGVVCFVDVGVVVIVVVVVVVVVCGEALKLILQAKVP